MLYIITDQGVDEPNDVIERFDSDCWLKASGQADNTQADRSLYLQQPGQICADREISAGGHRSKLPYLTSLSSEVRVSPRKHSILPVLPH
jgi:hypothetical protein